MAAPMKAARSKHKKEKTPDIFDELDLTSPNFNPLLALFSSDVSLPCSDVKPLDNLAKYESLSKSGKVDKHKGDKPILEKEDTNVKDTNISQSISDTLKKIRQNVDAPKQITGMDLLKTFRSGGAIPKQEPSQRLVVEDAEEEKKLKQRKFKSKRNVLTFMKGLEKGPLAMLKKCVEKRYVVKVWTRSAAELRGYCTGYIVGFDKHCNLAMMDVDETYRKPVIRDRRVKQISQVENSSTDQTNKKCAEENKINPEKSDSSSNDTKLKYKTDTSSAVSKCAIKQDIKTESVDSGLEAFDKLNITDQESASSRDIRVKKKFDPNEEEQKKTQANQDLKMSCSGDQNPTKHLNVKTSAKQKTKRDSELTVTLDSLGDNSKKSMNIDETSIKADSDGETSVWSQLDPAHIHPTTQSNVKLKNRHVNQLFIRGDNVVSIGVIYY